jgi:hypothetical protein
MGIALLFYPPCSHVCITVKGALFLPGIHRVFGNILVSGFMSPHMVTGKLFPYTDLSYIQRRDTSAVYHLKGTTNVSRAPIGW